MTTSSARALGLVLAGLSALPAGLALVPAPARAQAWPDKPLRLVVPVPPGGSLDAYTRVIGQRLSDSIGQPVLVDNRPGANGIVGATLVAKAAPDGYTLLMGATPTLAINVTMYAGKLPYDPEKDFTPISMVAKSPSALAVHAGVQATTLKEFVALAKASPGRLNYATSGVGSGNHLMAEMFRSAGKLMRENPVPGLTYAGFVEGDDIGKGTVDVVVTEGFSGNIALKTAEGTAKQIGEYLKAAMSRSIMSKIGYIFARRAFAALKEKMDPRRANGGVFLGLNGIVIKSHGGADALGFAAAIDMGYDMVLHDLQSKIAETLTAYHRKPAVAAALADEQAASGES